MSKRIANSKCTTKARNGRVRYGWKTIKAMNQFEKLNKALGGDDLKEEIRAKYEAAKNTLKRFIPKKMLRRHQAR